MTNVIVVKEHLLGRANCGENRLDAYSFQQDAITSFNNWQYCVYYSSDDFAPNAPRYVTLARRCLTSSQAKHAETYTDPWQRIVFRDYKQTTDDGHNTISMGICHGDGTIHLSFDHHCDQLRFRISKPGLATAPETARWTGESFSQVMGHLPGTDSAALQEVTYPRFLSVRDELIFECRIGMAGEGSDVICCYSPDSGTYSEPHVYLVGVGNNPYINGLSFDPVRGRIYVSWTYRQFVSFDKSSGAHRQQAGPNGPENNRDLAYGYSDDLGETWRNAKAEDLGREITPDSPGIIVRAMPVNSGMLNQEGQCIDKEGNFHVLMRDSIRTGCHEWRVTSWLAESNEWHTIDIPDLYPTATSLRGSIGSDPNTGILYLVLPMVQGGTATLYLVELSKGPDLGDLVAKVLWASEGFGGEPSLNICNLGNERSILSIFTTRGQSSCEAAVLDVELSKL